MRVLMRVGQIGRGWHRRGRDGGRITHLQCATRCLPSGGGKYRIAGGATTAAAQLAADSMLCCQHRRRRRLPQPSHRSSPTAGGMIAFPAGGASSHGTGPRSPTPTQAPPRRLTGRRPQEDSRGGALRPHSLPPPHCSRLPSRPRRCQPRPICPTRISTRISVSSKRF